MRFHIGFSKYISIYKLLKIVSILLLGLGAYFGFANIEVLASTSINLEPSNVELCNNATGSCSTNLLEKYVGTSSIRYSSVSGYGAISTFKVNYNSSEFSYYCYESEYNFHATYELDFAIAYRGVSPVQYGKFASIKVYANNVEIPVISTYSSSTNYYHIKFDYPGYNNNIRIELVQDDSILYAYPLALYTLRNNSITCIDQTTLSSVNQSINNSTNTIINNNNQNTTEINNHIDSMTDAQNDTNDYLMDDTPPTFDESQISDIQGLLPPGPVDSLLNIPFKFLTKIVNSLNTNTCERFEFTFVFDKQFYLPCFSELYNRFDNTSKIYLEYIPAGFILILYFKHLYKKVDRATKMETTADDEWGVI